MGKVFKVFTIGLIFMSCLLVGCGISKDENMKITLLESSDNNPNEMVLKVNYDDTVQYVGIKFSYLDSNGVWQGDYEIKDTEKSVLDEEKISTLTFGKIDALGGKFNINSNESTFLFPKEDGNEINKKGSFTATSYINEYDIVLNTEIPLIIYAEGKDSIEAIDAKEHFFNTERLMKYENVKAISIMFSDEPFNK